MLKLMMGDEAVGLYSAAVSCATLTSFIFVAIIDSGRPSVLEGKQNSEEVFCQRMKLLYACTILLALLQSVFITLLAKPIVAVLYGGNYAPSVTTLRIVVWFSSFSYMGAVRDVWILSEGKQKYLWMINLSGAAANVLLNAILIRLYGIYGAAAASLITQIFTNVAMGWIIPSIRPNNRLIVASLNPKFLLYHIKKIIINHYY